MSVLSLCCSGLSERVKGSIHHVSHGARVRGKVACGLHPSWDATPAGHHLVFQNELESRHLRPTLVISDRGREWEWERGLSYQMQL